MDPTSDVALYLLEKQVWRESFSEDTYARALRELVAGACEDCRDRDYNPFEAHCTVFNGGYAIGPFEAAEGHF